SSTSARTASPSRCRISCRTRSRPRSPSGAAATPCCDHASSPKRGSRRSSLRIGETGDNPPLRLVDSHCHLQADGFDADVDQVIGAARLAGVERILVPGWDPDSCRGALELVDRFPWLDAAVGVHPHDAERVDDAAWTEVVALATDDRVVATGETGLDYDRLFAPVPAQLANLRRNLRLPPPTGQAAVLHLPPPARRRAP